MRGEAHSGKTHPTTPSPPSQVPGRGPDRTAFENITLRATLQAPKVCYSRRRLGLFLRLVLGVAALGLSCSRPVATVATPEPTGTPWFADVTDQVDLNFVHDAGPVGSYFMPQIVGSGAALFDYDNDGRLDIYLVQNGGPRGATNRLFHQEADGRFTDVSAASGLDVAGYGMGVAIGDVNNDGLPDVFLSEYGRIRLFLNNGHGKFTDITEEAGLHSLLWGTSACFVDYDRDGWLDLVVANYVDYDPSRMCEAAGGKPDYCAPSGFVGTVAKLYHNLGHTSATAHGVRFEDVTLKSHLGRVPGPGLGVTCADFNGDGWPDIFVANDSQPNRLWINQQDGTFTEEAVVRGIAYNAQGATQGNMGIAVGDVSGQGLGDVFVTHLTWETNTLWIQGPRGLFRDLTAAAGLAGSRWRSTGFGTVLGDFDQDGGLDLAVVNGRVTRADAPVENPRNSFWAQYAERNQLFASDGPGKFRDISAANGPLCGTPAVSRSLAVGDIDGDGALDLLVTTTAGPARLYRNVVPQRGHWLLVRVVDPALKRDAYGAEVVVRAGDQRWVRWVNPGQSYLCSNDPRVHFGLGAVDHLNALEVTWPDGMRERFSDASVDRALELRKGQGKPLNK